MYDLRDLGNHPIPLIVLGAIWAWVSITLVIRLRLVHRAASFTKKFLWSLMLLVPVFGWMFYAGLFQSPDYHNAEAVETSGIGTDD